MYADDVKLFSSFDNSGRVHLIQDDLGSFGDWCRVNLMDMNLKKCKFMGFFRSRSIDVRYSIQGTLLEEVYSFVDRGTVMDRRLNFNDHINSLVSKASGVLGLIKRWAMEFSDPYVTKLFTALVRPILEWGSIVWDPQYDVYIDNIELVQKQFLLFALRHLHWNSDLFFLLTLLD
ncbi:uncharacterized protein LOC142239849 [Haematobia irritans]|uniref:uncharacterized protein LOC142239849 n=1 Tax=Haematobia irritans TaxID=7368 RepID=UPI003F50C7A2